MLPRLRINRFPVSKRRLVPHVVRSQRPNYTAVVFATIRTRLTLDLLWEGKRCPHTRDHIKWEINNCGLSSCMVIQQDVTKTYWPCAHSSSDGCPVRQSKGIWGGIPHNKNVVHRRRPRKTRSAARVKNSYSATDCEASTSSFALFTMAIQGDEQR